MTYVPKVDVAVTLVKDYSGDLNPRTTVLLSWTDTAIKQSDPDNLPVSPGRGIAWSPNGEFLTVTRDNSNTSYQTLFLFQHRVEDVGSLEVLSIFFAAYFRYNGNGSIRWQISGDGGITFVTIAEGSFNVVVLTQDLISGSGLWITSIQPGDDKLQVRMQVKSAVGGTVSTFIEDDSAMILTYRKKVLF